MNAIYIAMFSVNKRISLQIALNSESKGQALLEMVGSIEAYTEESLHFMMYKCVKMTSSVKG